MLSFKISKKSTSAPAPVTKSVVNLSKRAFNEDDNDEEEKPDFIEGLDGTNIVSKNPKKVEKKGLVIPLIPNTIGWAAKLKAMEAASLPVPPVLAEIDPTPKDTSIITTNDTSTRLEEGEPEPNNIDNGGTGTSETLEQLAVKELLEEATSTKPEKKSNYTIASTFQNKLQDEGEEEEEKMDASESALEDYERVPIEDFGLAMLRGMGWKESEGVGLKNKKVVVMEEPKLRPKGLGLGAEPARPQGSAVPQTGDKKEDLSIKVGNYALITRGGKKACYGQIVACDHDVNRVVVKLARGGELETISQAYIEVVTAAEYKKNSKVLNIDKYKEYSDKVPENPSRSRHPDERQKNDESRSRSSGSSEDERKYSNSKKDRRDDDRDRGRDGKHGSRRHEREYERDDDRDRDRDRKGRSTSTKDYKDNTRDYERDRDHKQSRSRERRHHDKESYERDSNSSKRKDRKEKGHSDKERRRRRHSSSDSR
ncbi:unnamed protein product [Orchesella dallaii]|uniref:G-patch domain-containing protein n=1 Tax=Orchesella dallaii TaxID=48710 RepID=A0ABP1S0Y7_9HEXA